MRRLTLIAALSGLALPAFADDAALLMGVDRYQEFSRVGDATDILDASDELRDAGYQVTTLSNGSARDMKRLAETLADDALGADRLVVALSGRFATDGTRTWFLAQDAQTPTPFGLDSAISVDTVLDVLARTPGQAVLVLGYDQDGFSSFGRYLREGVGTLDVPQGVTVVYGEPDRVVGVLTDAVTVPGGDVMAYVRDNRRLNTLGFQPQSLIMQLSDTVPAPNLPQIEPSLTAWTNAQNADTADSYRDFIFEYPRSPYADEARRRLDQIENDPIRLAQIAEDALNLTRNERRAIQRNLTLLEFDTRGVDGIFGPGTRGAIRNWQQNNGFAQTSYLTTEQINRIDAQASRRAAEIAAEEERAREQALSLDRDYWEETGARGTPAGYRAYLERYPDGIFADEARNRLAALDEANNEAANDAARAREDALNINPVLRRLIENRLQQLGFNPGQVDGRFDSDTRRAIGRYQAQGNLTSTGYLDQATLARLLADTFGR
ncbi:Putative peptidoglycan binding domain-containing protein [Yoonia rosea]|uniref:Putative peptidoglycan binding domain-containing protein n=1 Tax=Yoonia rosea TaxID=287098 RepID=A0A1R3XDE4_9RHOB|nr:peptidoglycan-binding protein [Yoonia rosea]SIT89353.1 Putative peptidoglycan binding domain-containing protein [Yoonia rosea]